MGSSVRYWSTTPGSNNTADPDITSADSQNPATVDDNIRSVMTGVRKQENDTGGAVVAGGSANAITVTTNQVLISGQLADGLRITVRATADNTATVVTFAPDGLAPANVKRADGSALAIGNIKSGMYLDLIYNSGASEWRAANVAPLQPATNIISVGSFGLALLTSGTVAAAASLDLVLTAYTGYRGLKFILSGLVPVNNAVNPWIRFSTDGGVSYISTANYHNASARYTDLATSAVYGNANASAVVIDAGGSVGNGVARGMDAEIDIFNQTSSTFWPKLKFVATYSDSSVTPALIYAAGTGANAAAQSINAIRLLYSSGNIAAGNYAVYGLL